MLDADQPPIGLALSQCARTVSRAFDARLAEAGGSLPIWLVLLALHARRPANQQELAATVGIQGATLTHHLNAMEKAGLVSRERDPANRRVHVVAPTPEGTRLFHRLRQAAIAHDRLLRHGVHEADIATTRSVLQAFAANVTQDS
jgi:MarR family transcriptional regulator for hemolysin